MKKEVRLKIFCMFIVFLSLIFVYTAFSSAQTTNVSGQEEITKAYDWLSYKVGNWNSLDIENHSLALLALRCRGKGIEGLNQLKNKKIENSLERCWGIVKPASGTSQNTAQCDLLSTAFAKIAVDSFSGENTSKVDVWIMNQSKFFGELAWFMQLDTDRGNNMTCIIEYNGHNDTVYVSETKGVDIVGSSTCFSEYPTGNSYWLQLRNANSQACYKNSYKIKCDINDSTKTFKVNLLYKASATLSSTWYVAPEIYSELSGKEVEVHAESYCLKERRTDSTCNYEGTAWATYALKKAGNEDYKKFIPYLVIKSLDQDNKKYFYQALLYNLGITTYSQEISDLENAQGFWKIDGTPYGQFYDTALAGLTGNGNLGEDKGGARYYLLNNLNFKSLKVGTNNYRYWLCTERGCSDVRDTAFILWSLWPGLCGGTGENCVDHNYECNVTCGADQEPIENLTCANSEEVCCAPAGTTISDCADANGDCKTSCDSGEFESQITCTEGGVCCLPSASTSCSLMYGIPCLSNEVCSGTEIDSLDGKCCLGTCTPLDAQNKDCALDLSGQICYPEACVDTSNWQIITPIKSQDSSYCCISNGIIKCVPDKTCGEISGQKCQTGERCSIDIEETTDEESCCTGECLKECSSLGGNLCETSEKCSGGIMQDSYEGNNRCCVDGTCKKSANLTWLWIVLIILIIGGGGFALYWFKFRKKGEGAKKPGEKPSPFGNLFGRPTLQQKQTTRTTTSTTFQQPGIVRPSSVQQTQRITQPIQSRKISKTKTDEELEKTLKKLKSMTKEKKK